MKIGIVTYHRSHNYGALLQAVALHYYLSNLGYNVYFVDYWPEHHKELYNVKICMPQKIKDLKKFFASMLKYVFLRKKLLKRYKSFDDYIHTRIIPYCKSVDDKYDILVYGSDQIWKKQGSKNVYDPIYFADHFLKADMYISYAASIGNLPTDDVDIKYIGNLLCNFDKISVREQELQSLIFDNYDKIKSELVLDPTLLIEKADWDLIGSEQRLINEKYLLHYNLNNNFDDGLINEFAKKHNCRVITITGYIKMFESANVFSTIGPMQFLSLIKYSDFVFTSSYHGLVFSIIYHKSFFASFKNNSNRAKTLLDCIGIKDRLIPANASELKQTPDIDYIQVDRKLEVLRLKSQDFLYNILH